MSDLIIPEGASATEPEPEAPAEPFVAEIRRLTNEKGHLLEERVIIEGKRPKTFVRFMGLAMISVSPPGVPPQTIPLQFPIEAESVEDAYAKFEATAQVEAASYLKQMQMRQTAAMIQAQQAQGLIIPSGARRP